jgi:hypothetical protein
MVIKAGVIVAHPDDCVIFAWPIIRKYPGIDWEIIYLTYQDQDPRAQEIKNFWSQYSIPTHFCGFVDDYHDIEANQISFDIKQAREELQDYASTFDLIVTHNRDGDYGHIHHIFVHACLAPTPVPQIYFASTFNNNYIVESTETYDLDLLPLHRSVVEEFQDRYIGRYFITDEAREILKNG